MNKQNKLWNNIKAEIWKEIRCVLGGCSPVDPSLYPERAETIARVYEKLRPLFEQDVEEQTSTDQAASSDKSAGGSQFAPSAPNGEESGVKSNLDFILSMRCEDPLMYDPRVDAFTAVHVAQSEERPAEDGKAVGANPAVDTFKPFRAWVACKNGTPDMSRFAYTKQELEMELWNLLCCDPAEKNWRVIEVEVREVGE